MEVKSIPLEIVFLLPIGILMLEGSLYGLIELWKWFIQSNE